MRTKNSDISVKIFLVVVAVILVGIIVSWSMGVIRDKKKELNDGTARINDALSSMADFDLLIYDGASISGKTLVELIKTVEEKGLDLTISVITLGIQKPSATPTPAIYNSDNPYNVLDKTDEKYINLNGMFKGEINRSDNDVIIGLTFTQY